MTTQARTTLHRAIGAALGQMFADIPPMQIWTAAAQKAAEDNCKAAVEAAAVTYAEALAQPTLFGAGEVA